MFICSLGGYCPTCKHGVSAGKISNLTIKVTPYCFNIFFQVIYIVFFLQGNKDTAFSIYEEAISSEHSKEHTQMLPFLFVQYSRFTFLVRMCIPVQYFNRYLDSNWLQYSYCHMFLVFSLFLLIYSR